MKKYSVFCVLVSLALGGRAQNLVYNPSFEQTDDCPPPHTSQRSNSLSLTAFWDNPTRGRSLLYHACTEYQYEGFDYPLVPRRPDGRLLAGTGMGFSQICAYLDINRWSAFQSSFAWYMPRSANYREYLQVRLRKPLVADEPYCLKMKVALLPTSAYAVANLGMAFTVQKLSDPKNDSIINLPFATLSSQEAYLGDTLWTELSGSYTAKGGEEYLILGNFFDNTHTDTTHLEDVGGFARADYFIDDVCVTAVSKNWTCDCGSFERQPLQRIVIRHNFDLGQDIKETPKGQEIVLPDVTFEFDKAILLPESFPSLNQLVEILSTQKDLNIEVLGHTDDNGEASYNLTLSNNRAQAVVAYLVKHGISTERLSFVGKGETEPLVPNDSEANRSKNRRVAFKIKEK